ncbi:MAG TPA: GNAT family N-acetyltransferase [Ktedonobacterales bacterium]|nr:GNAT family N-acetyltransferase [Ktedonobacterales bacterium]
MNTKDIAERVLAQRMNRYMDAGPSLAPWGGARFRIEGGRIRVGYAFARPGAASQVVERVLRFARDRRMQVQWLVTPERPGEAELVEALAAADFTPIECLLLMAHQGRLTAPANPRVSILPIATWHDMWRYEHMSRQCFYDDPRPSDALVGQRASERWREQEHGWCRYFQAYLDGTLAGGCYVSLYEDVPTIMGVCTLPQARRQGVATALLARTVESVMSSTNDTICLFVEVGNPAENLYRALGFVPLLRTDTYQSLTVP